MHAHAATALEIHEILGLAPLSGNPRSACEANLEVNTEYFC